MYIRSWKNVNWLRLPTIDLNFKVFSTFRFQDQERKPWKKLKPRIFQIICWNVTERKYPSPLETDRYEKAGRELGFRFVTMANYSSVPPVVRENRRKHCVIKWSWKKSALIERRNFFFFFFLNCRCDAKFSLSREETINFRGDRLDRLFIFYTSLDYY